MVHPHLPLRLQSFLALQQIAYIKKLKIIGQRYNYGAYSIVDDTNF